MCSCISFLLQHNKSPQTAAENHAHLTDSVGQKFRHGLEELSALGSHKAEIKVLAGLQFPLQA